MIYQRAIKKALQSPCSFKVAAIALDRKGELLGITNNRHGMKSIKRGSGVHAEREALRKWKTRIATIILCRVNVSGELLPIHPCDTCRKILDRHGIRVMTLIDTKRFTLNDVPV